MRRDEEPLFWLIMGSVLICVICAIIIVIAHGNQQTREYKQAHQVGETYVILNSESDLPALSIKIVDIPNYGSITADLFVHLPTSWILVDSQKFDARGRDSCRFSLDILKPDGQTETYSWGDCLQLDGADIYVRHIMVADDE